MVTAVVLLSASVIGITLFLKGYYSAMSEGAFLTKEIARLEPLAKEYDVLSAELQGIETRIATIAEIRSTRLRWGRKLDQLYAILPDYVWFDKIELKTQKTVSAAATAPTSRLTLECFLAGSDEKRYAEFRRVLTGELAGEGPYKGDDFFADFSDLGYSGWSREDFPASQEGVALKFDLELGLKPLAAPVAPQKVTRPVVAAK